VATGAGTISGMTQRGQGLSRRGLGLTVGALPYEHSEAGRLLWALHAEQAGLYGFADRPDDTPPGEFALPRGQFLTARLNTSRTAVGCGGWHLLTPAVAEIKRMYVTPAARGRGVGRCLLHELERRAAAHGAQHILLETGALNTAALALYRFCGYKPRPPYVPGRSDVNRAMTKPLRPTAGETA
jgi:ribosomal protein S18 acetylase RimI-like enzyme